MLLISKVRTVRRLGYSTTFVPFARWGLGRTMSTTTKFKAPTKVGKGPSPRSWEKMWQNGIPPGLFFDAGRCEPALVDLIAAKDAPLPMGLALVPGCGRGYAVDALACPGRLCIGLEISSSGAKVAREHLAKNPWAAVLLIDFFSANLGEGRFDLIYDCTFLCALQPEDRDRWARRMHQLLVPGGELVMDIFPVGSHSGGPPFAMSEALVRGLLQPLGFVNTLMEPPAELARSKTSAGELISRWSKPM